MIESLCNELLHKTINKSQINEKQTNKTTTKQQQQQNKTKKQQKNNNKQTKKKKPSGFNENAQRSGI